MGIVEGEAELLELGLIDLEDLFVGFLAVVFLGRVGTDELLHFVPNFVPVFSREFRLFFGTRFGAAFGAHDVSSCS
jgi:hypothetical protein